MDAINGHEANGHEPPERECRHCGAPVNGQHVCQQCGCILLPDGMKVCNCADCAALLLAPRQLPGYARMSAAARQRYPETAIWIRGRPRCAACAVVQREAFTI